MKIYLFGHRLFEPEQIRALFSKAMPIDNTRNIAQKLADRFFSRPQFYRRLLTVCLFLICLCPLHAQQSELLSKLQSGLSFHLVNDMAMKIEQFGSIPLETEMIVTGEHLHGSPELFLKIDKEPLITGKYILAAHLEKDEFGLDVINLSFDEAGSALFADITRSNVGRELAIKYNSKVIVAPIIQQEISSGAVRLTNIQIIKDDCSKNNTD